MPDCPTRQICSRARAILRRLCCVRANLTARKKAVAAADVTQGILQPYVVSYFLVSARTLHSQQAENKCDRRGHLGGLVGGGGRQGNLGKGMIMVHFQPFGPQTVRVLRDEVDRLFDSFAGSTPGDVMRRFVQPQVFPAVNLWEQDDAVFVEAELPGVHGGDLDLSVSGDELLLKGKRVSARESTQAYHRRERGEGEFARVVKLPVDVNADAVEATLENGVLLVRLPKAEAVRPRKISISARQG